MKDEASFCANIFEAIRNYALSFYRLKLVAITSVIIRENLPFQLYLSEEMNRKEGSLSSNNIMIEKRDSIVVEELEGKSSDKLIKIFK